MTFQIQERDVILSTRNWTEDCSPLMINYTEQVVQRHGKNYRVTTKRTTGPLGAIQRRKWKKFGAAASTKHHMPKLGRESNFEFTQPDVDEHIHNGIYITKATKNGWSKDDIKKIVQSDRPDQAYLKIFDTKLKAVIADAKSKITVLTPVADTDSIEAKPVSTKGMGIRERLAMKKKGRTDKPDAKGGITAKFNQRRNDLGRGSNRDETKCTLFVENVPDDYTETDIRQQIADHPYRRVNIVKRDGVSIGKAFIELETEEDAKICMEVITGARWGHCVVSAQVSRPKKKK